MKWCRFQVRDKVSYGIVEDEARVLVVSGTPFETYTVTATTYPLSAVKLLVPVIPPTFYAGGLNYPEHVRWWANYSGTPPRVATEPGIGYRTNNALIAHVDRLSLPPGPFDAVSGGILKYRRRDPAMPDDAVTVDYTLEPCWIVGDPSERANRLDQLYD